MMFTRIVLSEARYRVFMAECNTMITNSPHIKYLMDLPVYVETNLDEDAGYVEMEDGRRYAV